MLKKDDIDIYITRSKDCWRYMIRLLSKNVEGCTHKPMKYRLKNKTPVS